MEILISGANEGIGYYIAKQLLEDKHKVYALDIQTLGLENLAKEYEGLRYFKCDISNYDNVCKTISSIDCKFDIVIHNACKCTFQSLVDTPVQTYKEVFNVNYFGAVNITKGVIKKMKSKSKIMYVSSGVAVMGFADISPYANSKNAIESLARCMNVEQKGTGISFHIIHPPLTATRSSEPLPIPKEFMQYAENVGRKIAKRLHKNSFIICHSNMLKFQTLLIYLLPTMFGKLFSRLTANYNSSVTKSK